MRQVDRGLKKSQREIEREIRKLQMEEKKTLAEIKKLANQGQKVRIGHESLALIATDGSQPPPSVGSCENDGEAGGATAQTTGEALQGESATQWGVSDGEERSGNAIHDEGHADGHRSDAASQRSDATG